MPKILIITKPAKHLRSMAGLKQHLRISLIFVLATQILSQQTFKPQCHCERVEKGHCAYTLWIPLGGGYSSENTCPSPGATESSKDDIANLEANLTQVRTWAMQNTQLLSQLQAAMLTLQNEVLNTTANPNVIRQMQDTIQQHENAVASISNFIVKVGDELNHRHEEMHAAQMNITDLQKQNVVTEEKLLTAQENVQVLQKEVESLKMQSASSCRQKGLGVSEEDKSVAVKKINVSSQYDETHGPDKVLVNEEGPPGAWCARKYLMISSVVKNSFN